MGLLGRLTGWDQQKDAINAVLANHLAETASPELRRKIVDRIVTIQIQVRRERASDARAIVADLSNRSRIVQMNFIALACNNIGIPPSLNGLYFENVENPYRSDNESSLNRIGVALDDLSRRSGRQLHWPGNHVRIDFLSWLASDSESLDENLMLLSINIALANYTIMVCDSDIMRLIATQLSIASGSDIHDMDSVHDSLNKLTNLSREMQMYLISQILLKNNIDPPIDGTAWNVCKFDDGVSDTEIFTAIKVIKKLSNTSIIYPKASLDFRTMYYSGICQDYGFSGGDITPNGII